MRHALDHRRHRRAWSIVALLAVLIAGVAVVGASHVEAAQERDWWISCPPKPGVPPTPSPTPQGRIPRPETVLPDGGAMVSDGGPMGPDPARLLWHGDVCNLQNRTIGEALEYHERWAGINLGFDDQRRVAPNIRFERQAGVGPIFFDEPVAIHVSGAGLAGYLKYQERDYGINLGWSSTPVYEWRIRGGEGVVFRDGFEVSLYNTVADDAVVYAERCCGINLRWF
jgi:hypothetical protein